jgi:hypothetical protein
MTAFLTLNGIVVPVHNGGAPLAEEEIGSRKRALDGSLVIDRRALKRGWAIELVPDIAATQLAFRDLLDGKHEVWSWETGAFSSKGNPAAFTGGAARTSAQFKYGAWSAVANNTEQVNLTWLFFDPSTKPWAVAWWQRDAGVWHHYSEDSAGTKRKDGATSAHAAYWTTPAAGTLRYTGTATVYLDEVWVLRFLLPVAWEAAVYAATLALGAGPVLRAEGTLIEANVAAGLQVAADSVELDTAMAWVGGVLQQVHTVKAKLREV